MQFQSLPMLVATSVALGVEKPGKRRKLGEKVWENDDMKRFEAEIPRKPCLVREQLLDSIDDTDIFVLSSACFFQDLDGDHPDPAIPTKLVMEMNIVWLISE